VTAAQAHAEVRIGFAAALTGPMAWGGVTSLEVAELAVAAINARGGVLGERIEMITADDYCDGEQAVAAANKLVEDRVVAVIGHPCSAGAIPASKIYANADILMISDTATNPQLTEQGFTNVFRLIGRDDVQGRVAGDLLADHWGSRPIAILHDGQTYGKGLAEETRKRLNERGVNEEMFEAIEPGKADYWDVVQKMRAKDVEVLYFGGFPHEAGLIIRQAHEHGYALRLLAGDGLNSEDFALIAGPASDGTLMTNSPFPDLRNPEVAEVLRKFPDLGTQPVRIYTAPQVWAQAVEIAGTFGTQAVAAALRSHQFDTMLGRIGFDQKGDVTGYETFVWYVWKDGKYAPVEPGKLTE
jgi:branched-chain amino acid transport system substrate-binding protein